MSIEPGQNLPNATFTTKTDGAIHEVPLAPMLQARRVVIFGLPGAFTPTCSSAHLPSFVRVLPALKENGVDEVVCVSVNDPHVMEAWARAEAADGITMLSDAGCIFTEAIGMRFDAPQVGLVARSVRYSMLVDDGIVTLLNTETERGVCKTTAGETMLQAIQAG